MDISETKGRSSANLRYNTFQRYRTFIIILSNGFDVICLVWEKVLDKIRDREDKRSEAYVEHRIRDLILTLRVQDRLSISL